MNTPTLFEETQGFSPWVYGLIVLVLCIMVAVLMTRQKTTVSAEGVTVRIGMLYTARIPIAEIARAEAVSYRPIRDYGGWGIRGTRARRALTTRGDRGVLLIRTNGSTLLIGSQQPRELLAALSGAGVPTEDALPAAVTDF
jgi:hypothetical protein